MANVLVTGGGRGLGLSLVRQLADDSSIAKLFVTTRGSLPAELSAIINASGKKVIHIKCEVVETASVQRAAAEVEEKLEGEGLDVLINNIGVSRASEHSTSTIHANKIHISQCQLRPKEFTQWMPKSCFKFLTSMSSQLIELPLHLSRP